MLKENRIDCEGDAPSQDRPLCVHVTALDEANDQERGRRMAEALRRLSESKPFDEIADPSA